MISLKFYFNQLINEKKGAFNNMINKNTYLCVRIIRLEIDQPRKVIKYVSG